MSDPTAGAAPEGATRAHRVLVVDDEPNIVTSLQFLLRRAGYDTSVAVDGVAALEEVDRFGPDLVLLDVMMPRLDGFAVCQTLRARPDGGPRVVMLTAKGRDSEMAKGLALGADAYVTKPFSTRDLLVTVAALLGDGR